METYLVTGGAGFIGSNFVQYMLQKYQDVRILNLDKLTYAGNLENLASVKDDPRYTFIHADICDKAAVEKIFAENDVDYVVNFAAESHVDRSIREPEVFVKTNVEGTVCLLNAARNAWNLGEMCIRDRIYPYLSKLVMNPGIYYIHNIRNWHSTSAVNNAESVKGYIAVANVDMEVYSHLGLHDEVQRINNISSHYLIPLLLSLNQVKAFSDKQRVAFLQGLEKQKGFQFTMDDSLYAKVKAISNRKAKVARLFLQKKYGLLISLARTYDLLLRFKEKIM